MLTDLSKIKTIRKQKGITQKQLAKSANVSQALIARIENGTIDPSYSKAIRILSSLELKSKGITAEKLLSRKVYTVKYNEKIHRTASLMKNKDISQLPVIKGKNIIGSINETSITHAIADNPDAKYVEEIMEDPLPIIDHNASVEMISSILKHSQGTLVSKNSKVCGIITRADMLKLA